MFSYAPGGGTFAAKLIKSKRQGPSTAGASGRCLTIVSTPACAFIKFFRSKTFRPQLPTWPALRRPCPRVGRHPRGHRHLRDLTKGKCSRESVGFGFHGIRVWSTAGLLLAILRGNDPGTHATVMAHGGRGPGQPLQWKLSVRT